MGSRSSRSPPNSSESLNGLKFGKTIYFEDVGIGVPAKLSGGSSSGTGSGHPPPLSPAKKVRNGSGGFVQGSEPPRCSVEGCNVDLSGAKAYYARHKVCGMHSKSPRVVVAGLEQRFCQQCSRFHQLPEFDQGKRSCRRRLAGHNERRRKPPPGSLFPSRYGRFSSSTFETSGGGGGGSGFLMDFSSHRRVQEAELWPTTRSPPNPWHNNIENPQSNLLMPSGAAGFYTGIPPGDIYSGVSSDSNGALSLLSNQPWGSSSRASSGIGVSNMDHFSSPSSWTYKGNENVGSSHEMGSDLGLVQSNDQFSCEFDHSPNHHVHWSL